MGFLTDTISLIRLLSDEPETNAKYTDAQIIKFIETDWGIINRELGRHRTNSVLSRANITLTTDVSRYRLPPVIGTVVRMSQLDDNNRPKGFFTTSSVMNPAGLGISLQYNTLVLEPDYSGSSATLAIDYIAHGSVKLHAGTCTIDTSSSTETLVTLGATPTTGSLDQRENAYVGQILRVTAAASDSYEQDLIVTAYDVTTRIATCKPAANTDLLGTYTGATLFDYEVTPMLSSIDSTIVAYAVARRLIGNEGDTRYKNITQSYVELMRDIRLAAGQYDGIRGHVFGADSVENQRYLISWWT
jgi:hypothetical protein